MPIRPNQTSCTCCIIPLLLAVAALIAGMIYGARALLASPSVSEKATVTAPRSTDWQKAMSKRCLLGDVDACRQVKATRPDVR